MADIERLAAPVKRRIEHEAKTVFTAFAVVGGIAALAGGVIAVMSVHVRTETVVEFVVCAFVLLGLVPAILARAYVRIRVPLPEWVLTHGVSFPVELESATALPRGYRIDLRWQDRGTDRTSFDVERFDRSDYDLRLFVHKGRWVVVILDGKLYLPLRNQYYRKA